MESVLNGNLEAFEPLVSPYRKSLLTLAYRMTQNREDAKEISQETLLRAFKYLKRFDVQKSFKNWLFQIMFNAARNLIKKREIADHLAETRDLASSWQTAKADPEQRCMADELKSRLTECLVGLSLREREVFLLRDIEECSIKESARILGCSSISIRVNLCSARKKIREKIKEKFPFLLERLS